MKHLIRTTLIATTATTALLLTGACGGSDDGSDEEIEGVEEGGSEQEPEETEEPQETPGGAERPEIAFPDSWENVWEDWESDDATEQALLNDAREARNAVDLAILERDVEADYVTFYHAAESLSLTEEWVEGFINNDRSIAGSVRYFNPVLTLEGDHAALTYCGDESDATAVDFETGESIPDDSGDQVSYSTNLEKNEDGVWVTTSVTSEREMCAP